LNALRFRSFRQVPTPLSISKILDHSKPFASLGEFFALAANHVAPPFKIHLQFVENSLKPASEVMPLTKTHDVQPRAGLIHAKLIQGLALKAVHLSHTVLEPDRLLHGEGEHALLGLLGLSSYLQHGL
jgi:hypothetical protein